MLEQLIPLFILAAIFGLYTVWGIAAYLTEQSFPKDQTDVEDLIKNITPTETPLMRLLRDKNDR